MSDIEDDKPTMTDADKRAEILKSMRLSVKAFKNGADMMQKRSDAIARIFQDIHNNDLPYEESVAKVMKDAGVSITLLSFFTRSQQRGTLSQNMFFMSRLVMEEGSDFLKDEEYDRFHMCEQNCKHQDDFYYFILSNYKATPKIKKLVKEWKELGKHDSRNTHQHDRFVEIFMGLETELAKDKFKIRTTFRDLV